MEKLKKESVNKSSIVYKSSIIYKSSVYYCIIGTNAEGLSQVILTKETKMIEGHQLRNTKSKMQL